MTQDIREKQFVRELLAAIRALTETIKAYTLEKAATECADEGELLKRMREELKQKYPDHVEQLEHMFDVQFKDPAELNTLVRMCIGGATSDDVFAYVAQQKDARVAQQGDDLPEGFIKWDGGECPVPKGTMVDVIFRDGGRLMNVPAETRLEKYIREANGKFWHNDGAINDIVAYRVVEELAQPAPAADLPEGFSSWVPDDKTESPLSPDVEVEVILRDGRHTSDNAGKFCWARHDCCPMLHDAGSDIIGFRVVEAAQPTDATVEFVDAGVWYPWTGGECPVGSDVKVKVLLQSGRKWADSACGFDWSHDGPIDYIVAFKIKKGQ